jgi:hypothetical protein
MLEMRPNCECCDRDLEPRARDVFICSFECTFCAACADGRLGRVCPNCGGLLVLRAPREGAALARHPASTRRIFEPDGCADAAAMRGSERAPS